MRLRYAIDTVVVAATAIGIRVMNRLFPDRGWTDVVESDDDQDDDPDILVCYCCGQPWPRDDREWE